MTDWMTALASLAGLAPDVVWRAFLVFLRVGGMMALLPAFGEQTVPTRVRLGLTVAFTAIVAPAVAPQLPPFGQAVLGPAAIEAAAGLILGFGFRLFIQVLQIAGAIAAQATSLSQMAAGAGVEPQPAIGQILLVAGLALATASGLHVQAASLIIKSYDVLPSGRVPFAGDLARWGLGQVTRGFGLALSLAAPFAIASTIYNLALGVINRAMPALMVSFIGAPLQTLGGLVLLAVTAPIGLVVWQSALRGFVTAPFSVPP